MRTNLRHVALGLILALGCATAPASKSHGLAAFPTFPATSGGGGLSTVTTSSPVSGDGSSGNPVTVVSGGVTAPIVISGNKITVSAATTSASGSMSASDKTLTTYIGSRWENVQQALLIGDIPGLTGWRWSPFGLNYLTVTGLTAVARDASVEGGGVTPLAGGSNYSCDGMSQLQTMKTGKWGWCARMKVATVSANDTEFGWYSSAGSDYIILNGLSTADATHMTLQVHEPAIAATQTVTTFVPNGTVHDFCMDYDGTAGTPTITVKVDGTTVATSTTTTHLRDGARYFCMYNTTPGDTVGYEKLTGYVKP